MSYTKEFTASLGFPVRADERWIVRGIGGEPDEHWRVMWATQTQTRTIFRVEITERHRGAFQ